MFDLVVAGGDVVDGTGRLPFRADVGVTGERIEAVGDLGAAAAAERLDVAGNCVAPGFTMSAVMNPGRPIAATRMSAARVTAPRSRVFE